MSAEALEPLGWTKYFRLGMNDSHQCEYESPRTARFPSTYSKPMEDQRQRYTEDSWLPGHRMARRMPRVRRHGHDPVTVRTPPKK